MIDYFALLDQARRPWVDQEQLKKVYYARTRQLHPDAVANDQEGENGRDFAELNEGYRTLSDTKLRLQHLLELSGVPRAAGGAIPREVEALFASVSSALSRARAVLDRVATVSSALVRGLAQGELTRARAELDRIIASISELNARAEDELRALDAHWSPASADAIAMAQRLHQTFTYVARWRTQLEEMVFQLSCSGSV